MYTVGDDVWFGLKFSSSYDEFTYDEGYLQRCGQPGRRSGLYGEGFGVYYSDGWSIPFGKLVEIPISVGMSTIDLCSKFTDIEIELYSICEDDSSDSWVYQYGAVYDEVDGVVVSYNSSARREAFSSSNVFSVAWNVAIPESAALDGSDTVGSSGRTYDSGSVEELQSMMAELKRYMIVGMAIVCICTVFVVAVVSVFVYRSFNEKVPAPRRRKVEDGDYLGIDLSETVRSKNEYDFSEKPTV